MALRMAAVTRCRECTQLIQKLRYISSAIIPADRVIYRYSCRGISFITGYGDRHKQNAKELSEDAKRSACHRFTRGFKYATGFSALAPKSLNSMIDVEKAKDASPDEISSWWNEYHLGRGHISAVMTSKLYHLLEQRTNSCLYFVIPLWRGTGYTSMFLQAKMPHMLFTGLEDYKARGTQASPYLTVTYYKEFAEDKGLVLVRGDIVFTSKLSDEEASWLLETAHSFYLNDTRYKLVEQFNREARDFEFKDVLQALDMPLG